MIYILFFEKKNATCLSQKQKNRQQRFSRRCVLRPAIPLGTGVVYAAASLIVSAVTGGEADILLIAGVLAVCVVLTMVVGRLYASAAAVTGILVAGLYLASVLLGGEGLAVYDYIILVVALLGGVVASAAIGKYLKNRKQTD